MRVQVGVLVVYCSLLCIARGFMLDGSPDAFAQLHKWNAALNGSLELEFKTEQPNGLLLYTDDGGTYDFFEIKLVEGALRLRYNLGSGAQILTVGHDLQDGHWHSVRVRRRVEKTSLTVDNITQTRVSRGKEFRFGHLSSNSWVYIGGMPAWYNAKLTLLALPSVIFEPRFVGFIRNVIYADPQASSPRRQLAHSPSSSTKKQCIGFHCSSTSRRDVLKTKEKRSWENSVLDPCEEHDPCKHGGICISTDSGPICECRNLDFEGIYCEKDKAPSEATFRGLEFLLYDQTRIGGEPVISSQDTITLHFRTKHSSGLILHAGDGSDYLNVAIKDGGVAINLKLAMGKLDMYIRPNRLRFDDNQWHHLSIHRRIQEISALTSFCRVTVTVDNVFSEQGSTAGAFTFLTTSRAYIGGSENPRDLPGSTVHSNFVGCLRRVEIQGDTTVHNFIELAKSGDKGVSPSGRVSYSCPHNQPADPISFLTPQAYLVLPTWEAKHKGSISLKFITNEPSGLLIYSTGPSNTEQMNLFAVELVSGHLVLHLNLGSGPIRVKASRSRLDDKQWHEMTLYRDGKEGTITVDGVTTEFVSPGEETYLDLQGGLFLGGFGGGFLAGSPSVWSMALQHGFVGCVQGLHVDGHAIDIVEFARHQDIASIKSGCHQETMSQCESAPCINSGRCTDGWNRYICDCTGTSYSGPICANDDLAVSYNGSQFSLVSMPHEVQSHVEDIVLRFRTARPNGFLLSTSSEESPDRLQVALISGRLAVTLKVGDKDKTIHIGHNLHDNLWHSLRYTRRLMNLLLQLDHTPHVKVEVPLGKQGVLQYHNLHLGSFIHAEEEIQMTNSIPNFIGSIQKFQFNNERYLDLAWNSALQLGPGDAPLIRNTGQFASREQRFVHHAITFRSRQTYVALPPLQAFRSTSIYFQLKTRERDALLLYSAGREADFLAVELVAGHVHLIINLGDGPVRIKDYARTSINDNKWHAISITRPYPNMHSLSVDDVIATAATSSMAATLDLSSLLYIGGIPKEVYLTLPKDLHARHGFEGCLSSLEINGNAPDLTTDPLIPSSLTTPGCLGHNNKCSQHVCANRGVCVQQWNSFTCDCDMTSYTGPTCSDESVAYEFGPERGIITFVFPEDRRPEMKSDVLAFAFITSHHDAVILRVESATSNDYIEVEIVEGNIFVVYNMGTTDNPIGETFVKVNDGFYHVLRFTRNEANSTLQLDDFNLQTNFPSGNQLSVFNSVGSIQIGGKWNRSKQRIERPFSGVLAGLVLNGQRVLDLAADKDPRTQIRGDVTLVTSLHERIREPLLQKMQQTPPDHSPGVSDDLVFSGAGSGCPNDDEDSCTPSFDTSPGDDLITPVYVPPTPRSRKPADPQCRDDDEDCVTDGSGDDRDDLSTPELPASAEPSPEYYPNTTDITTSTFSSSSSSSGTSTALSTTVLSNENMGQQIHTTVPQEETTGTHTGPEILKTPGPQMVTPTQVTITNGTTTTSESTTSSKLYNVTHVVDISVTHTDPTTTTTTITSRINVAQSPLPAPPTYMYPPPPFTYPPHINKNQITSETAEATAFVILVIAGTLIAIILVILLILKLKQGSDSLYTMDESKTSAVSQGHHQALLPSSALPCSPPSLHSTYNNSNMNPNSSIYNNNNANDMRPIKRPSGGQHVKEWYV